MIYLSFPEELEDVRFLTPFAIEFRYDFLDDEDEDFDVEATLTLLKALYRWVKSQIGI